MTATATSRPEKQTGTEAYAKFAQRMLRSYGRKATAGDLDTEALSHLAAIQAEVDAQITVTVIALRADGHSWEAIAAALGMTKAGAYSKFKRAGVADPATARKVGGQPGSLR